MKALYRKYRPLKLSDVVGQDKTIHQLQGAISQNKISHAYLFIGPRGCGKTSVARIFAHEINQFDYQLEDSYVDIIEIDAATFTGVDNIRELREKAMIIPTTGKYKVYIIDEVHMLSTSAFNALLKILEEPPTHVVFIMATTNPEKIPATIASRTQIYRFSLAEPELMQNFLRKISDQEGINISDAALRIISERGGGSFRDSLSILDQLSTISDKEQQIDETAVSEALGIPSQQGISDLLQAYQESDTAKVTETLSILLNAGFTADSITTELIQQIIKAPSPKTLPLIERLFSVTGNFLEAKLTVALISTTQSLTTKTASPPATSQTSNPAMASNKVTNSAPTAESSLPSHSTAQKKSEASNAFANIRNQLVKNAKNHKAEHALPPVEPEDLTPVAPPTLPEAVVDSAGSFNFNGFVANVSNVNPTLLTALKKSFFLINSKDFDIYPEKPVYWRILSQKNNLDILRGAINSINLTVKNPDTDVIPKTAVSFDQAAAGQTTKLDTSSPNLSSLSAIMGDIQEVTDNPFQEIGEISYGRIKRHYGKETQKEDHLSE